MKKLFHILIRTMLLFLLILIPAKTKAQQCEIASGYPDNEMNTLFASRNDNGWTGGDGTYAVGLPDGRTVWMFGDSFLGTVNPDGTREGTPLIRNALMMQSGQEFTTLPTEHPGDHTGYFSPPNPDEWYWPLDGTVVDDKLYLFFETMWQEGEGGWGFARTEQIDIIVLTIPDLTYYETISLPKSEISYGSAILENDDGYVYIYGTEYTAFSKHAHVARTPSDDFLNQLEYFDGDRWSSDPTQSARIFHGVSSQFSVIKQRDTYYLITQEDGFGTGIYAYGAKHPTGKWSNSTLLYCTPETEGDLFTYNAVAHPHLTQNGELLVSYNVNSFNFWDVFEDASNYRPRFFRVTLPEYPLP